MSILFDNFQEWRTHCQQTGEPLHQPVISYEVEQKNSDPDRIFSGLLTAYEVMKEAVQTGLTEDMTSRSGMINNGAKRVYNSPVTVLSPEFQKLISRALAAKEVNSCMGRVVAAPTAGASGILPGTLVTLQELHQISDEKMVEAMLVAAGIALIIERNAGLAGAVGGCQAETGSAAAMAAGAIVYALGGNVDQVFNGVAITVQCMLGLVCDPVAGLVEVPCVVRNASAAAIAILPHRLPLPGSGRSSP